MGTIYQTKSEGKPPEGNYLVVFEGGNVAASFERRMSAQGVSFDRNPSKTALILHATAEQAGALMQDFSAGTLEESGVQGIVYQDVR